MGQTVGGGEQPSFGTRDPQPYLPRDAQFFSPRDQHQYRDQQQHGGRHNDGRRNNAPPRGENDGNMDSLPSFITGGGQPQGNGQQGSHQAHGPNGHDNQGGDRFPLHRRRRRHRGPRPDTQGGDSDDQRHSGD